MMTRSALAKLGFGLIFLGLTAAASLGPAIAEEMSTAAAGGAATAVIDKSPAGELALWNSIKDSQNADDFSTYLDNFPNGMFVDPAKDRYEALSGRKYEPNAATDMSKPAPVEPATIAPPAKTAKVKAKSKPVATIKSRPKRHVATIASPPRKRHVRTAVVQARPIVKKRIKVASRKKSCGVNGSDCPIIDPAPTRAIGLENMGGRSGNGGGGGGGGGGWH